MDHEEQLPPPDWSCEPLDSLADVRFSSVDKKTTPGERPVFLCNYTDVYNDEYITGDEAFMRASATPAEISTFGLRRGDVVITKDSETPDDIGIPTAVLCERQDLICGYHLALIRPDLQRLDPLFLAKQIRTNRIARYFGQQCNGLTRYGLPTIAIEHAPIWLPKLPEQQQIGIVLSRLDATIRETARVVAKLKLIKNGLLHDLLTLGVDDTGAIRAPDQPPGQFVASPIGRIPRSWEYCRLFSHIDFPQGQVSPLTHPYRDWQLIAPDHIESGTGRLLAAPTAREQGAISGKYVFALGDVLYSKIRPYLRKVAMAPGPGLCSADMYPLRPHIRIAPFFLLMLLLGEKFSRFASAVSMRSGFPKINRDELATYWAALPPREEQDRAAVIYQRAADRLAEEQSLVQKLTLLKQGMMNDLLTGRVRVPVALISQDAPAAQAPPRQANIFFRRAVLAAEITHRLHAQATFGRVKLMKALYLCDRIADLQLESNYLRAAAGPFDNRMLRSIETQLERQKWFGRVARENGIGWSYVPLPQAGAHAKYYEKFWGHAAEAIDKLLSQMAKWDTLHCEVVATLFSVWEDLIAAGRPASDEIIVTEVLTNWHESKQRIDSDRWYTALRWMRGHGIMPSGGAV